MPVVYACIAPHGDELIPRLAAGRPIAKKSIEGMRRLAIEMKEADPETIVVATPHNLRLMERIGVVVAENSSGKVGDPGAEIALKARCDVKFARDLIGASKRARLPVVGANFGTFTGPLSSMPMDWGTLIPLWFFLKSRGAKSRIVIVAPSRDIPLAENVAFGKVIGEVAEATGRRVAFVASADQAHTHAADGPYGFSRSAAVYDRAVVKAIERDRLSDVLLLDGKVVEDAKPDSLWQMAMLVGLLEVVEMRGRLYSYEVADYFGMLCAGYSRQA